jgi:hypothetical protein
MPHKLLPNYLEAAGAYLNAFSNAFMYGPLTHGDLIHEQSSVLTCAWRLSRQTTEEYDKSTGADYIPKRIARMKEVTRRVVAMTETARSTPEFQRLWAENRSTFYKRMCELQQSEFHDLFWPPKQNK